MDNLSFHREQSTNVKNIQVNHDIDGDIGFISYILGPEVKKTKKTIPCHKDLIQGNPQEV